MRRVELPSGDRGENMCSQIRKKHFSLGVSCLKGTCRRFSSLFGLSCYFAPVNWNVKKCCNTRAGDENKLERGQKQQTARTEGGCVPAGAALSIGFLRCSEERFSRAASGHWKKTRGLSGGHLASSTAAFRKGNVLSMLGWMKADGRPLLCWHSWVMQQPSAKAIYTGKMKSSIPTWGVTQEHVLY